MRFIWDTRKAASNLRKHGLSFEEASSVLADDLAVTSADPDHSFGQSRWITFGQSAAGRLLAVSHVDYADMIRIVSARAATRFERKLYEEG